MDELPLNSSARSIGSATPVPPSDHRRVDRRDGVGEIAGEADADGLLITGPYMTDEDFQGLLAIAADVRVTVALREQDQGAWTGLTKQQIKQRWPERLRERPRKPVGGESPDALLERVRAALASIAVAYRGARVLAITHTDVIRTLEFAMSLAAPPVPQLEGRWLRVQPPAETALEPGALLTAGELTSGRATAPEPTVRREIARRGRHRYGSAH